MLAFFGAALAGLVAPVGCVVAPEGGYPSRASMEHFFLGPDCGGECGAVEATCGTPSDECACETCPAPCEQAPSEPAQCEPAQCRPPHKKLWHHLPKCHLYEPEAGIFNFCIPPQCINPPPPLPPGRFFPVPVQPAFAQRGDTGYGLLMGGNAGGGPVPYQGAPCP